jgi:hypothetical protein
METRWRRGGDRIMAAGDTKVKGRKTEMAVGEKGMAKRDKGKARGRM